MHLCLCYDYCNHCSAFTEMISFHVRVQHVLCNWYFNWFAISRWHFNCFSRHLNPSRSYKNVLTKLIPWDNKIVFFVMDINDRFAPISGRNSLLLNKKIIQQAKDSAIHTIISTLIYKVKTFGRQLVRAFLLLIKSYRQSLDGELYLYCTKLHRVEDITTS